jgi:hypothetical protein
VIYSRIRWRFFPNAVWQKSSCGRIGLLRVEERADGLNAHRARRPTLYSRKRNRASTTGKSCDPDRRQVLSFMHVPKK